jgi:hypothetical protein
MENSSSFDRRKLFGLGVSPTKLCAGREINLAAPKLTKQ